MKPTVPVPALVYIVDWQPGTEIEPLLIVAERALEGGVNWIHLRAPLIPPEQCLAPAHTLRRLTHRPDALFSVNPHLSVALQTSADGVHLPEIGSVSSILSDLTERNRILIGKSVHCLDSALQAVQEGCDYLLVGTMFETGSHPGKVPEGLELLRALRKQTDVPLIAIGGITPERVAECVQAGAAGVAAISTFNLSANPTATAKEFLEFMREQAI